MAKGYLYDNGDELISREDVNEVPDSSSAHAGDVLSLDSNKKPKWSTPESELPDATSASEGDVLSLNASKDPVWSTPSGGGGDVLVVTVTDGEDNTMVMDKTYSEIYDAVFSNGVVFRYDESGMYSFLHLDSIGTSSQAYVVICKFDTDTLIFTTDSSSGYPVHTGTT